MTLKTRLLAASLALSALWAGPAAAQRSNDCPPVAQQPTQSQIQTALQNKRDRGMLWRVTDKAGQSSWLYGTMHIGRFEWVFLGPTVAAALRTTDVLALEIDVTNEQMRERLAAAAKAAPVPAISPALTQRLARARDAACVSTAQLGIEHPVMQSLALTVMSARRDGLDPAFSQELALASAARQGKRPIVSLETPEQQIALLLGDKSDRMVGPMLEQLEQGTARKMLARLADAWERGDLGELENYEKWCDCAANDEERAFVRRLNDERNPALADAIDKLHKGGKRVFAAVGALHMTGPKALPALLAQRGYTVERAVLEPQASR